VLIISLMLARMKVNIQWRTPK